MTMLQIELKPELAEALQNRAEAEGQTVGEYVQDVLAEYLIEDEDVYQPNEEEMDWLTERIALVEQEAAEKGLIPHERAKAQVLAFLEAERIKRENEKAI